MQDDTIRPESEGGSTGEGEEAEGATDSATEDRDPFRVHLSDVQDFVNEFVSGFRSFPYSGTKFPRYDMIRADAEYSILVDVPGVPRERLEVSAVGDELTISGDRPRPTLAEGAEVLRTERSFGRFRRTIHLPADVDVTSVRAKLDGGVLRVTLPRRGGAGTQKIDIEG